MTDDADGQTAVKLLDNYAAAWNRHDLDGILSMMTSDCVMQLSAGLDSCGTRFVGPDQVRIGINQVFAAIPDVVYNHPKHLISGDRGLTQWLLTGTGPDGPIEVHGCDLFTIREGKIAVKDSYRKHRYVL
jgi:ketosteroid isomerase-like protein